MKAFKISSVCYIKTCRSLKRRAILKIPSIVFRRTYALSVGFKMEHLRKSVTTCQDNFCLFDSISIFEWCLIVTYESQILLHFFITFCFYLFKYFLFGLHSIWLIWLCDVLLQNASILLQNGTVITKCVIYYKMRPSTVIFAFLERGKPSKYCLWEVNLVFFT